VRELALYAPVKLTEEQKKDFERRLSTAFKILKKASVEIYNFANIKKLRNEYKNGTIQLSGRAKLAIDDLIELEKLAVSGYIGMAKKICKTFQKSYGISVSDYLQEAAFAIYDAMYLYNGKTRFSTYAFWSIRNRILDFYRNESKEIAFNDAVELLRLNSDRSSRIKAVKSRRCDQKIKQADDFDILTDKEGKFFNFENINPIVIECLATSIYQTGSRDSDNPNDRVQMLLDAIESASLTDMERCLIEAEIREDSSFRTRTSETVINPNTGKLWTKQRLSQLYIRACEKIRAAMDSKLREAA
jgi:RNA polymerase sigma factor (sigma-70 family)